MDKCRGGDGDGDVPLTRVHYQNKKKRGRGWVVAVACVCVCFQGGRAKERESRVKREKRRREGIGEAGTALQDFPRLIRSHSDLGGRGERHNLFSAWGSVHFIPVAGEKWQGGWTSLQRAKREVIRMNYFGWGVCILVSVTSGVVGWLGAGWDLPSR